MEQSKEITQLVAVILVFATLLLKRKNTQTLVKAKTQKEVKAERLGMISLIFLVLSFGALLVLLFMFDQYLLYVGAACAVISFVAWMFSSNIAPTKRTQFLFRPLIAFAIIYGVLLYNFLF